MKTLTRLLACLLLLTFLLPASALAMAQEEWDLSCNSKTSRPVDAYQYPGPGDRGEFIATLPANTYIHKDGVGDGWRGVTWMINGVKGYGWIEDAALVRCSSQIRGSDGFAHNVHELDPSHDQKVTQNPVILIAPSLLMDGNTDYSGVEFELPDSPAAQAARNPAQGGGQTTAAATATTTAETTVQAGSAGGVAVTLEELGTHASTVSYQSKTKEVPTADLNFGKDVPEDKKLAVIYTPKTGKASLRSAASGDAEVLKQCKAGRLVSVLEYGKPYSLIHYKNTVGYILTHCLKFHGIPAETGGMGVLSYKGKTNGSTTINVRLEADGDSRKVGEFRTGTEVTIIQYGEEWCEIEVGGIRGFVMSSFLVKN